MVFAMGEWIKIVAQRHRNYSFFHYSLFIHPDGPSVSRWLTALPTLPQMPFACRRRDLHAKRRGCGESVFAFSAPGGANALSPGGGANNEFVIYIFKEAYA